jgi:8-oxo-dGTP diphosphatase
VARLDKGFGKIVFGDKGQQWAVMPVAEFLAHPEAVGHRKNRLADYLDGQ